jgi:hypothetical protein
MIGVRSPSPGHHPLHSREISDIIARINRHLLHGASIVDNLHCVIASGRVETLPSASIAAAADIEDGAAHPVGTRAEQIKAGMRHGFRAALA